jgi:hypothetical protein
LGLILVVVTNVRGAYHKDRHPKWYVRIALTAAGCCFVLLGLHGLGVLPT